MTVFGFGLAHIFFQLVAMVIAATFAIAAWDEKGMHVKFKYLASAAIIVGWFGVAVTINGLANVMYEEKVCDPIDYEATVDGHKIPMKGILLCQGDDGRMFVKGPRGEIK